MPLICYQRKEFKQDKLQLIAHMNRVLESFKRKGFDCSLRQLYYQLVTLNLIPNKVTAYDNLGNLVTDARMAGLMDWDLIVDRTRYLSSTPHWTKPSAIIASSHKQYSMDLWDNQDHYLEVWVEKDALRGVIEKACIRQDVGNFSCRGYTSSTGAWQAAQRMLAAQARGKECHIIHLGDHDPSGIHMSVDIRDRINQFTTHNDGHPVEVVRIALTMEQVQENNLVPNPAKTTDSRYKAYEEEFGEESWELDALSPDQLVVLVTDKIDEFRNAKKWEEAVSLQKRGRDTIGYIAQYFPDVVKFIRARREVDDSPIVCTNCLATQNNPRCICKDTDSPVMRLGEGE